MAGMEELAHLIEGWQKANSKEAMVTFPIDPSQTQPLFG